MIINYDVFAELRGIDMGTKIVQHWLIPVYHSAGYVIHVQNPTRTENQRNAASHIQKGFSFYTFFFMNSAAYFTLYFIS